MEPHQRASLQDDLRGILEGEVLFDEVTRTLYSTDASIFQLRPLGVVVPRHEADVQAVVRYAAENHISLIARGAGTGLAGESLGTGLVLDLSRHFRQIVEIGTDTVRVQPGVVYRDLNARLAPQGRRFAPDPASGEVCTLGGMLATNASGTRALRHGYTRDHVASLRVVLDNGEARTVERESCASTPGAGPFPDRLLEIVSQTAALVERHHELIQSCRPRTPFNRCGYLLHDVLDSGQLDLARLLVGSEGTLALFTEATLRTVPLPGGRSLVLFGFDRLESALGAVRLIVPTRPASCDLLDRRLLALVRGQHAELGSVIPHGAEALLLVEYEADTLREATSAAQELAVILEASETRPHLVILASESGAMDRLWSIREAVLPNLLGLRGGPQPLAAIEDVGVPPEELAAFVHRAQDILQKHETTASFLIHAGSGQVHTRPFLDLRNSADAARLWALAEEIHAAALALGGTVSTQHGTGLARTPWVARQYGPLYPVFEELKRIFDPHGLFNPGKIIGPDPALPAWPLRELTRADAAPPLLMEPSVHTAPSFQPVLAWRALDVFQETLQCNGCGTCRTEAPEQRMCPIFRVSGAEAATPRAKANLLRDLLRDSSNRPVSSDEVRAVADLCVNCKMCALECPAHVNIPKLMLEAKAANVAEHGLRWSDWVMARTERFAALGSLLAYPVNGVLASRTGRWFLEKLFGVSQRRRLPRFTAQSFLRRAARKGWTQKPTSRRTCVVYFVDVFANYNDPTIGTAVVAVLQHNGIEVYVPPGQVGCGIAPLAYGDVDTAREAARINVRLLADLARQGHRIVCSEPSAALMLRYDYLDLLDEPDTRMVAEQVVEFTAFLEELDGQGRLRHDFKQLDLSLGHHVPCHLKALRQQPAAPRLLRGIPGVRVRTIDVHCSGMAGTFGLKAANHATSVKAGEPLRRELARPDVAHGSSECSTCRMQMEDLSEKRALHPAQYLALAYGYLPELRHRLERPFLQRVL